MGGIMPVTLFIVLAFVIAVIGAVIAIGTRHRRAGFIIMLAGLLVAGGLSMIIFLSLQNM
jgi:hypothetical protein